MVVLSDIGGMSTNIPQNLFTFRKTDFSNFEPTQKNDHVVRRYEPLYIIGL